MENKTESENVKKLSTLIEALAHSGSNTLEENMFKEVKKICKSSQTYIPEAYRMILKQLRKNNSQIRFIAFLMCKELFNKSAVFREHLLKDLKHIFELTAEINPAKKLPLPKSSAKALKALAISTLKIWVKDFGETYKKLKIALHYFQNSKKVDFVLFQESDSVQEIVETEHQRRLRIIQVEKMRKLNEDINHNESEIHVTITSLSNCLNLLLPPLEDFFISDSNINNKQMQEENINIMPKVGEADIMKGVSGSQSSVVNDIEDNNNKKNKNSENDNCIDNNNNDGDDDDDDDDDDDENEDDYDDKKNKKNYTKANEYYLRQFGITSNYNLLLEINPDKINIVKNEENSVIIENAKDYVKLINHKFLPMVKKWAQVCSKYGDRNNNELKKVLDLKEKLETVLKKYNSLTIEGEESKEIIEKCFDDSSDDDFEEVKKEGYEEIAAHFSEDDLLQMSSFSQCENKMNLKNSNERNKDIPLTTEDIKNDTDVSRKATNLNKKLLFFCFASCTCKPDQPIPSTSKVSNLSAENLDRKTKLMAIAPKLPYDIDLYHWEDEDLKPPTLLSTKIDVDKFWGSCNSDDIHEIPNPEGLAALRTRVIEFTGTFTPVKWACRAPLPNGKLCPRKDRYKCPFHGKIVPRDNTGKCENKEDEEINNQNNGECSTSNWQDPQLLKDLKAATGIDLKLPEKKGLKRKRDKKNLTHKKMKTSSAALKIVEEKKLPGLIDVIRKQNNSYTRLSKKIFNRSSLKRVSSALNKIDRKKYQDKFGDQFNYI